MELREKPGIGLRLAIDKLNLDAYLSKDGKKPAKKAPVKKTGPVAKPSRGSTETARPADPASAAAAALNDLFDAVDALSLIHI